jgi:hypothetical protein
MMPVELNEISNLLNSDSLNRIETRISEKLGISIYKDDLPILTELIKKEIDSSGFSIDHISKFINDDEDAIVNFGFLLLKDKSTQMLSIGVSITYAIYLIFLQNKDDSSFEEYLVRRGIPDSKKVLKQIKSIGINSTLSH